MADLATPSAATMGTLNAGADNTPTPSQQASDRPQRPDEDAYKANLEKATKTLEQAQKRVTDAQARVNSSTPGKSATAPRQSELREQLNAIKSKQAAGKSSRQQSSDRIKQLDAQMKAKMNDQKTAKAQFSFKSTTEIDAEIKRLESQVESGKLKMVDERKAVAEVSSLHKQKKGFGALDQRQQEIDNIKAAIADLKTSSDRPEQRGLEADYEKLNKEMTSLRSADMEKRGDINAARDALKEARDKQNQAWTEKKKLQDEYYTAIRKSREYEREAARVRDAKRKADQAEFNRGKRQEALERKLEEASLPAYGDEIRAADSVIRLMDPSSVPTTVIATISKLAATAERLVDDSGIVGTRLSSRKTEDEESYFVGTGGKKGKKNKKSKAQSDGEATSSTTSTVNSKDLVNKLWAPGSVEQFNLMDLEPPSNAEQISTVLEQVKEKREYYLKNRDSKTQENIDNARKEFDAHEAEASRPSPAPSTNGTATKSGPKREPAAAKQKPTTNGSAIEPEPAVSKQDSTTQIVDDMENAKLDDAQPEANVDGAKAQDADGADDHAAVKNDSTTDEDKSGKVDSDTKSDSSEAEK